MCARHSGPVCTVVFRWQCSGDTRAGKFRGGAERHPLTLLSPPVPPTCCAVFHAPVCAGCLYVPGTGPRRRTGTGLTSASLLLCFFVCLSVCVCLCVVVRPCAGVRQGDHCYAMGCSSSKNLPVDASKLPQPAKKAAASAVRSGSEKAASSVASAAPKQVSKHVRCVLRAELCCSTVLPPCPPSRC